MSVCNDYAILVSVKISNNGSGIFNKDKNIEFWGFWYSQIERVLGSLNWRYNQILTNFNVPLFSLNKQWLVNYYSIINSQHVHFITAMKQKL